METVEKPSRKTLSGRVLSDIGDQGSAIMAKRKVMCDNYIGFLGQVEIEPRSFKHWVFDWTRKMISKAKNGSRSDIFNSCRLIVKNSTRVRFHDDRIIILFSTESSTLGKHFRIY